MSHSPTKNSLNDQSRPSTDAQHRVASRTDDRMVFSFFSFRDAAGCVVSLSDRDSCNRQNRLMKPQKKPDVTGPRKMANTHGYGNPTGYGVFCAATLASSSAS